MKNWILGLAAAFASASARADTVSECSCVSWFEGREVYCQLVYQVWDRATGRSRRQVLWEGESEFCPMVCQLDKERHPLCRR